MPTPDFSKVWASNSPLPAYTFTDADYLTGWDFVGSAPPTKNEFDAWFRMVDEKLNYLYGQLQTTASKLYPVGSVYISFNSTSPSTLFGGTWVRLKDKFLLANGDSYAPNTTGGSPTKTIGVTNLPAHNHTVSASGNHTHSSSVVTVSTAGNHTHARGTMDITGTVCGVNAGGQAGAFTRDSVRRAYMNINSQTYTTNDIAYWNFTASNSWTGETATAGNHTHTVSIASSGSHTHTTNNTGGGTPLNIMPPYQTVYMWRRTA